MSEGPSSPPTSSEKFDRLKDILRTMFQLDRGALDFGLYRIMNLKAEEIINFLDNDLLPQVQTALDENEKKVVEGLAELAESHAPCLQGKELYLIRNLTRGRGGAFFDDFGYYPDFIVWLHDTDSQHGIFLDPKGVSRFGAREREKVNLYRNIKTTEERIRETEPNLLLHAYLLSVTPPDKIDDGSRSSNDWKNDGVYFLHESSCLQQVIEDVLNSG